MSHLKTLPVFEVTQQCDEGRRKREEEGKDRKEGSSTLIQDSNTTHQVEGMEEEKRGEGWEEKGNIN